MKLNKKIVSLIIILISVALTGLVSLQVYLLDRAIELEKQTFKNNVNNILNSIVKKLETQEALMKVIKVTAFHDPSELGIAVVDIQLNDSLTKQIHTFELGSKTNDPTLIIDSNKVKLILKKKQHVSFKFLDSLGKKIVEPIDDIKTKGEYEIISKRPELTKGTLNFIFNTSKDSCLINLIKGDKKFLSKKITTNERRHLIDKVINDLTIDKPESIMQRINPVKLDSIIKTAMQENSMDIPYTYGIIAVNNDSLIWSKTQNMSNEIIQSEHRIQLFPNDIFVDDNYLVLHYPNQQFYLLKQSTFLTISSLIFIMIIIFCFIYVIRAIFVQKKFSNLLVDFINNMTHEFKTPISTISLVSENLSNPVILKDEGKILKYTSIIHDESLRMRNQVEKILQMAALEGGEFELNSNQINIHDLIEKAVEKFSLKIEKQNGEIIKQFNASLFTVEADIVHLANIIHNLLDNAVKYTKQEPTIIITTNNTEHHIKISIKDNGIGLKSDHLKKVFDKYYRVPTGNVHNVKGVGLGLSYVKLITEAHNGKVNVLSELGQGSTFEIILPIKNNYEY